MACESFLSGADHGFFRFYAVPAYTKWQGFHFPARASQSSFSMSFFYELPTVGAILTRPFDSRVVLSNFTLVLNTYI